MADHSAAAALRGALLSGETICRRVRREPYEAGGNNPLPNFDALSIVDKSPPEGHPPPDLPSPVFMRPAFRP